MKWYAVFVLFVIYMSSTYIYIYMYMYMYEYLRELEMYGTEELVKVQKICRAKSLLRCILSLSVIHDISSRL